MRLSGLPPVTHAIGRRGGASLLHVARSAVAIGYPLNTAVTIHMGQFGSAWDTVFHDFADLREWFRRWSSNKPRRHPCNGPATYAYVHENENDLPHTHWMVHVHPLNRPRFLRKLTLWLLKRFGLDVLPAGVLDVRDVYNAEGFKKYLAKNLDPHLAKLWRIDWEEGGPIAYRRADVSRNLGPSVWKPLKAAYKASRGWASGRATAAPTPTPAPRGHAAPVVAGPHVPAHVHAPGVPANPVAAMASTFHLPQVPPGGRCSPSPLGG